MKTLLKFSIAFASASILAICTWGIISACAWGPMGDEYRISLFDPNTAQVKAYQPLYFSVKFLNDGEYEMYRYGLDQNLEEWRKYLGNKFSVSDIESVLYSGFGFESFDYDKNKLTFLEPSEIGEDEAILSALKKSYPEALRYFIFARRAEYELNPQNAWWLEEDEQSMGDLKSLEKQALAAFEKTKDEFIKFRYAYQLVVITRYQGNWKACVDYYTKYIKPSKVESNIRYWAMVHVGTALWNLKKGAEADYMFAQVFDQAPAKRLRAFLGFEGENMEASLKFCTSETEKARLASIAAFKNPGRALSQMQQVYNLDGKLPALEILLLREVNKLEDWILSPKLTGYGAASEQFWWSDEEAETENKSKDVDYLKTLVIFIDKALQEGKIADPLLWKAAKAHLFAIGEDFAKANSTIAEIESDKNLRPALARQVNTTKIMVMFNSQRPVDAAFEQELYAAISKFRADQNTRPATKFDYYNYNEDTEYGDQMSLQDQMLLALAYRYEAIGDIAKAGLLISRTQNLKHADGSYFYYLDRLANSEDMAKLLGLVNKSNKTAFEGFITDKAVEDLYRLNDLHGTILVREHKLAEALKAYDANPAYYWNEPPFAYDTYLDANPFYADFYSEHLRTPGDTVRYTKPGFVKALMAMEAKAANAPKNKAFYAFQCANAHFNISTWGNSWMQTRYSWSTYWETRESLLREDAKNHLGLERAMEWYQKAADLSQDKGFKAMCIRMLAKCQKRHDLYVFELKNIEKYESFDLDNYVNPMLTKLRKEHADVADELIDNCMSIEKFLARWDKS
jgi:hypothetical protein